MMSDRPVYMLGGTKLENTNKQRDLGVIVDSSLEFNKHINKCTQRAYASWGMVRRTFEKLRPELLNLTYKTFVRPHIEFCPEVWSGVPI